MIDDKCKHDNQTKISRHPGTSSRSLLRRQIQRSQIELLEQQKRSYRSYMCTWEIRNKSRVKKRYQTSRENHTNIATPNTLKHVTLMFCPPWEPLQARTLLAQADGRGPVCLGHCRTPSRTAPISAKLQVSEMSTHLGPGTLRRDSLVLQIGISHHDHLSPVGLFKVGRVFLLRQPTPQHIYAGHT